MRSVIVGHIHTGTWYLFVVFCCCCFYDFYFVFFKHCPRTVCHRDKTTAMTVSNTNKLPFSIRHTQTYSSFKWQLKTHLFSQTVQQNPGFYVYDCYGALCVWFAVMRCVPGPCIAALRVLIALTVLGCALCCWRWIVWCMHVSCIDSDVHSCFELWSALSQLD